MNILRKIKSTLPEGKQLYVFGFVLLVNIIILISIIVYKSTHKQFTVNSFAWKTEIQIEHYETCHESGWSIPNGGRETDRERKIHYYRDEFDHYDEDGNPVYRSKPVYDNYYYYDIERWIYKYGECEEGTDKTIKWKEDYTLPDNSYREGERVVKYYVLGETKKGNKIYTCDEDIFKTLEIGGKFTIVTNISDNKIIKLKNNR